MKRSDQIKLGIAVGSLLVAGSVTYFSTRSPAPAVKPTTTKAAPPAPAAKPAAPSSKGKKPAPPIEHFGGGRVPGSK